jgi:hypothetical protein
VLIIERWLLGRLRHRRFYSLAELNATIGEMLRQLNEERLIRRLGVTRRALLEELDRLHLRNARQVLPPSLQLRISIQVPHNRGVIKLIEATNASDIRGLSFWKRLPSTSGPASTTSPSGCCRFACRRHTSPPSGSHEMSGTAKASARYTAALSHDKAMAPAPTSGMRVTLASKPLRAKG